MARAVVLDRVPRPGPFNPDALVDRVALALHTSRAQVRTAEVQPHALPTLRLMASDLIAACEATGIGLDLRPFPDDGGDREN